MNRTASTAARRPRRTSSAPSTSLPAAPIASDSSPLPIEQPEAGHALHVAESNVPAVCNAPAVAPPARAFRPDPERWPYLWARVPRLGKKLDLADKAGELLAEATTETQIARALVTLVADCCFIHTIDGEFRPALAGDLMGEEDGLFESPADLKALGVKLGLTWFDDRTDEVPAPSSPSAAPAS